MALSEGRREGQAGGGRTGVCRSCGALVGAGEAECMMCGAPTAAGRGRAEEPRVTDADEALAHPDPETRRFVRAIISRPAPFTLAFLTACVFLFLLTLASGLDQNSTAVLTAYGAKVNAYIDERGEWWRFVAPIFLHGSWVHLLVNMYGLFMLGPYVEKLYGSAKFTLFWVATGVGGTVASYLAARQAGSGGLLGGFLFRHGDVPSVGASGALFGLVGVLFVFGIKFRHELPEGFKRAFGTGMLPMIVINLFIGFVIPFIDNAAHLGGLVTGAALALVVDYKRPGPRGPVDFAWHALQAGALALVVAGFGMVARHFQTPALRVEAPVEEGEAAPSPAKLYSDATNRGLAAFAKTVRDGDPEAAQSAIEELDGVPELSQRADALREELKALLARARDFASAQPQEKGRAARSARAQQLGQLAEDHRAWVARFHEWVETEGGAFNLSLKPAAGEGGGEAAPAVAPAADDKK